MRYWRKTPAAVAAEVVVNTGLVLITGEITTNAQVNYVNLVRKIAEIGYTDAVNGFCLLSLGGFR